MRLLPNTLLCFRVDDVGVLLGPNAERFGQLQPINYYGRRLDICLIRWDWAIHNQRSITRSLPGRTTFGLLP